MKHQHKTKLILLALQTILILSSGKVVAKALQDTTHKKIDYAFKVAGGKLTLSGIISIPSGFKPKDKLLILVSPPMASDRNYFHLFTIIADAMCKWGIAVLRFDNRAYTFPDKYPTGSLSMVDQAADVLDAIKSLKQDEQFGNTRIGLLGHSEGGCSVAIAAANNRDIDFVIMLSSMGIPGKELTYYQFTNTLSGIPLEDGIKKSLTEDFERQLNIVNKHSNTDSIKHLLLKNIDSLYQQGVDKKQFGNMTRDEMFEFQTKYWINNHRMMYSKFEPGQYYPNIKCPALIVFGTMDEKSEYKTNTENIVRIFKKVNKVNYKLMIIDSLDHNYQIVTDPIPVEAQKYRSIMSRKGDKNKKTAFAASVFDKTASWVHKL